MSVKVEELIRDKVITTTPSQTAGHVKKLFETNHISALPVVDSEEQPVGIITTRDLINHDNDQSPVSSIMTKKVYTISSYSDVQLAARMMTNHHIHHLVVTHEKKVIGIISSFDLLKLVENHRFVAKNPSTPKKKGRGHRAETEG